MKRLKREAIGALFDEYDDTLGQMQQALARMAGVLRAGADSADALVTKLDHFRSAHDELRQRAIEISEE